MIVSPPSSEKEFLEKLAFEQMAQHPLFFGVGECVLAQAALLDPVAQPAADGVILDVHVLDADVAAVGLVQQVDHRVQGHLHRLARPIDFKLAIEVLLGELHVVEA